MNAEPRVLVWLLLETEDNVLLGKRKPDRPPFAGEWVLPGEEMPGEESASETVVRFARDQLDLRVTGDEFVNTMYINEDGVDYAANVFRVAAYEGRPRFRESGPYTEVKWVPVADIAAVRGYSMPPALRESLGKMAEGSDK
jgi:ADP-ribose pyrophosphatase YjhB (NUDIX family)